MIRSGKETQKKINNKVLFDISLNIVASALPIAILQLVIYPPTAAVLGGDEYGLMLTIYSIWIMISNSLGNVLNNIKLLKFPEYQKLGVDGDVAVFLRQWLPTSSFIVFWIIWFYCGGFSPTHVLLGTVISAAIFLKAYLEVGFRIKLDYVAILINNMLLCGGYFLGYLLFKCTGIWEFIFLTGYVLATIYCATKTRLLKEPYRKTEMYREVKKDTYSLLLAALINNLINYADKLVLFPLMGGTAVSIYYTATILGKITGMLTGPINSVILSYITRWDKTKANIFTKVILIGLFVITAGYVVTLIIARPIIGLLFPQWVEEVMSIIPLTTVTIMLNVLVSILQPFVLKFCDIKWQIIISAIGSGSYFVFALILWRFIGLKGFCIGTIIGVVVKICIMVIVYYRNMNQYKQDY